MRTSDLFLQCLEAQGVEYIFGVPGEENADIMISLLDSKIKFITCRHEQVAAFMADMYGRLTGKPGICLSTLGPGATNLLTGVANANMDHAPVVAIIGQAETSRLHKESHQNMDSVDMYKPVTKWATTVREASVIPEVVEKAFKIAVSAKPGACLIELPEDIAHEKVKGLEPLPAIKHDYEITVSHPEIEKALSLISKAKKAVIIAGAGCTREDVEDEMNTFVNKTGIYAANTFMGKGVVSAKNDHCLFCVGLGMKDLALEAFDQADLVIAVGYDMVEWHPNKWNNKQKKKIIHIDTLPAEVDAAYIPDVELVGNIKNILTTINDQLTNTHKKDSQCFAKLRKKIADEIHEYDQDVEFPVKPQRSLSDLRSTLRDDDILISDVGAHKMWVARHYPSYHPKTCLIYNGFCSMGGAMPGAVMAKMIHPEKHVVALCGDGGFMMSIQALITAAQLKLPIVVVLWDDDHYGLIKWKQEMAFKQHSHVDLVNPNFAEVAKSFGAHGVKINEVEAFVPELKAAFAREDQPTVIVVPIDYRENMKLYKHLGNIISH